MQTIFLATNEGGGTYGSFTKPDEKDSRGVWCGRNWFSYRGDNQPPPGECKEYRLVPVEQLSDDDAETIKDGIIAEQRDRIAELEAKLAERSPGVMPECVGDLLTACQFIESIGAEGAKLVAVEAEKVREYYETPFVFDGTEGRYEAELTNGKKFTYRVGRICGDLVALTSANCWLPLNSDGTFPGGRITGRVE